MYVTLIYLISLVSWSLVSFDLIRLAIMSKKSGSQHPSLLIPLIVSSIGIVLENAYFGIGSLLYTLGYASYFDNIILAENNWFIVKFIIAFAGMLFLYELRRKK